MTTTTLARAAALSRAAGHEVRRLRQVRAIERVVGRLNVSDDAPIEAARQAHGPVLAALGAIRNTVTAASAASSL